MGGSSDTSTNFVYSKMVSHDLNVFAGHKELIISPIDLHYKYLYFSQVQLFPGYGLIVGTHSSTEK